MIPTAVTKCEFYRNQPRLEEYRAKWTKSPQLYDKSRTYLGSQS
jgi:hypothetical protein